MKKKIDRLFVPLSTGPFTWFKSGRKKWELRKYGRQYTEKHVYKGRLVELRCGYSDKTRALWGTINAVEHAPDIRSFFGRVSFKEVIPLASSIEDAISQASAILNIQPNENQPVIGFKIKMSS